MKDFRFVFRGLFAGLFIFLIIAIIASLSGPDKPKKPYVPAQRSTTEKPVQKREPVKAKVPPGTFVNEQAITFNDLNIGEEILLCEGSDYCRQVFDNYTKLVSKEFGEPGRHYTGSLARRIGGALQAAGYSAMAMRLFFRSGSRKRTLGGNGSKAKNDYLNVEILAIF